MKSFNLKVVNQRNLSCEVGWSDIYVARPSPLGNPFVMKQESDRSVVVAQYRQWLWKEIQNPTSQSRTQLISIAKRVKNGEKIRLICWCKQPDKEVACHADIIVRAIFWVLNNES